MNTRRNLAIALWSFIAALIGSQVLLYILVREVGVREYDKRAGAGLATPCGPHETTVWYRGPNTFVVRVTRTCGPKAGEGMSIRLYWSLGGWRVEAISDHYVV